MKQIITVLLVLGFIHEVKGQSSVFPEPWSNQVYYNESYGEYSRNKFDIILPEDTSRHGLVIFIHGGGFKNGDKKVLFKRKNEVRYLLDNNIAVAGINYRFYVNDDSLGVRVCLKDIQRALQFLRFNADTYQIDKERIACYGVSAGAGSSLYLAFHDDMAIPGDTTLLGESTRIKCAGALSTQATYNVLKWKKIIPFMRLIAALKHRQIYTSVANIYGYPEYRPYKAHIKKAAGELDMLSMIDSQDPPVYLSNLLEGTFPKNNNILQHHRKHAVAVSRKLNKFNVMNYCFTSRNTEPGKDVDFTISEFMVKYLNSSF